MDAHKPIMLCSKSYVHNTKTITNGNVEEEKQMFDDVFFRRSLSQDDPSGVNVNDTVFRVSKSTASFTSTYTITLRSSKTIMENGKKRVSFTEIWKGDSGINHAPNIYPTNVAENGSKTAGEKAQSCLKSSKVDETYSPTTRNKTSNDNCLRVLETKGSFDFLSFRPPTPPNASHLTK